MEIMDQGQHRISQVYLRQFGYKDKHGKNWISVWKLGDEFTDNKSVKSFTKEVNIFDLPFKGIKYKRLFEELNCDIESYYPRILSDLKENQKLTDKSKAFLISLVVNFLCRTEPFRRNIETLLKSDQREFFLTEITSYLPDKAKNLKDFINNLRREHQLNFTLISVWYYMCHKLTSSNFDYVIIQDFNNRGWLTTDNPVVIINNVDFHTLVSKETEIYFPISADYCLYMDHMDYNKSRSLRGDQHQELIISSAELHEKISDILWRNAYQYVIWPVEFPRTKLSK
jgi:Protein of unknown function (DUF4238)